MYGLFLLFKTFFPLLYDSICRLPIIGKYLSNRFCLFFCYLFFKKLIGNDSLRNKIDSIAQKGPRV